MLSASRSVCLASVRKARLPRHRRADHGRSGISADLPLFEYVGVVQYINAEAKSAWLTKLLRIQLQLLSSPLWKWAERNVRITQEPEIYSFEIPDIRWHVRSTTANYDALWGRECRGCLSSIYGCTEAPGFTNPCLCGGTISPSLSTKYATCTASFTACPSPFFSFDACLPTSTAALGPNCWFEGYEGLKKKQQDDRWQRSRDEADRSVTCEINRDPISRSIEANFHFRLIARRVDQTLISSKSIDVH